MLLGPMTEWCGLLECKSQRICSWLLTSLPRVLWLEFEVLDSGNFIHLLGAVDMKVKSQSSALQSLIHAAQPIFELTCSNGTSGSFVIRSAILRRPNHYTSAWVVPRQNGWIVVMFDSLGVSVTRMEWTEFWEQKRSSILHLICER